MPTSVNTSAVANYVI
jgi:hypothetical protein